MEGGFEAERGIARPEPGFEPPVDPGRGPSLHGLALVARIMQGRELAAEAAGIPPLDSDQVLDLQRTAGNQLTTGALARWTDLLAEAPADQPVAHGLLAQLLPAQAADPALYAAICAALDALEPRIQVRVTCTGGEPEPIEIELLGPTGARWSGAATLAPGVSIAFELSFAVAFGPAATIEPDHALALTLTAPDGTEERIELAVPLAGPGASARFGALAELL
jgi:hypothetical protein